MQCNKYTYSLTDQWINRETTLFEYNTKLDNNNKKLAEIIDKVDNEIKKISEKNAQKIDCLMSIDEDQRENNEKANKINNAIENYKTLLSSSKIRFENHQYIYNNNIFKMIYLSSGILTTGFLILKIVQ